jgi:transcriptional regulator with XRE-family HTH domain
MGELTSFGKKVAVLRKVRGLTQLELGHKAGLHRTYIGMVERAEKNICLTNIYKIAAALEVEVTELFKGEQNGRYSDPPA